MEAGTLTKTLVKGFGATAEDVESFTNNMMSFATTSGVNARKVMRDISNDSNLTSIYLGRGEDALMRSAVLAAKMGKSMAEQNQTLDAFGTIEGAIETVAEINRLTGSNLDAMTMYQNFVSQDVEATMKALTGAFSTSMARRELERSGGLFKGIASTLNMTIGDLKMLPSGMKDFEDATADANTEQEMVLTSIKASTGMIDELKNVISGALLPAFNNLSKFLTDKIGPAIEAMTDDASIFGQEINAAMNEETTFLDKVSAGFNEVIKKAKPAIKEVMDNIIKDVMPVVDKLINSAMEKLRDTMLRIVYDITSDIAIIPTYGESQVDQANEEGS